MRAGGLSGILMDIRVQDPPGNNLHILLFLWAGEEAPMRNAETEGAFSADASTDYCPQRIWST